MKKITNRVKLLLVAALFLTGCARANPMGTISREEMHTGAASNEQKEQLVLYAAEDMETCFRETLLPLFEEQNPDVQVLASFDSSQKLGTLPDGSLKADVVLSAAKEKNLIDMDTVSELVENKLVLIVPADSGHSITEFAKLVDAENIAIGDPKIMPDGQYTKEALISAGIWERVLEKASLGENAAEVLNWVADGSANAGIVLASQAAQTDKVTIAAEAPEGSTDELIYSVGIAADSPHKDTAEELIAFLQGDEAAAIFADYGFTKN